MLRHSLRRSSDTASYQIPTPKSFMANTLDCPDPAPLPFPASSTSSTSTTSLPLSLLLTATRIAALHEPGLNSDSNALNPLTLSFSAVYTEYVRLVTSAKASASASGAAAIAGRIWGRNVAKEAWEKLEDWGFVVPVGSSNGAGGGKTYRIEISFEEVADAIGPGGAGALGRWWRET